MTAACGGGETPTSPSATSTSTTANTTTTTDNGTVTGTGCAVTPTETVGPYPSHGDYFRRNVTDGKPGLPLSLTIAVVNAASSCAPVSGATVEIWQCDHQGVYSEYGQGTGQNFLRGAQTTDAQGQATFDTVYPGWYQGRATHVHVEVTIGGRSVKVTQIAFPEDISNQVHTQGVYASRGVNNTTNLRDGIFADSLANQMATVAGSPATGMTATFRVGVNA